MITRLLYALVFWIPLSCLFSMPVVAEPFGLGDPDAVYSDKGWIEYRLSRTELASVSICGAGQALTSQNCYTGVHRFCADRGHASGYAVEADTGDADITCVGIDAGVVFRQIPHIDLEMYAKPGDTTTPLLCQEVDTGFECGVTVDRYCRSQAGFAGGFGPVERGAMLAAVACIKDDAHVLSKPLPSEISGPGTNCTFGDPVSADCRRSMDDHCRGLDPDLRGGFGPGELSESAVRLGCVREQLPWTADALLPDSPTLPVDVLERRVTTPGGTTYDPVLEHNALGNNRGFSFDGRLYLRELAVNVADPGDPVQLEPHVSFRVQTPEIFSEPLSQAPQLGEDRSYNLDVGYNVLYTGFVDAGISAAGFDANSSAVCDPHNPRFATPGIPGEQSVPNRVSNPIACDSEGNIGTGNDDHDCYHITVVTVARGADGNDEIWGRKAEVVVRDPKGTDSLAGSGSGTPAQVVKVTLSGSPQPAGFPEGQPKAILEPTISGDGRVIVIQGDGKVQYSVLDAGHDPCDVAGWTEFKHIYEAHYDPAMQGYGLAKYPMRDFEGNVLDPAELGDQGVGGAYPWISRDGDQIMFAKARSSLFYGKPVPGSVSGGSKSVPGSVYGADDDFQYVSKHEVLGHPVHGQSTGDSVPLVPSDRQDLYDLTDSLSRSGLTLVGLWTQGKMIHVDTRNNPSDFTVRSEPTGPPYHRLLRLYDDVPAGTEVGTSAKTLLASPENQFFFRGNLRPDTPRETVWHLASQHRTDEFAFDDVLDPRALVVSSMATSIFVTGELKNTFADGFITPPGTDLGFLAGEGFLRPAHIANEASPISQEVVDKAMVDLSANVGWNPPSYGYLLGGARSEPIAAGGYRSRGLWLDGVNDRLEYIVPPQPSAKIADFASTDWWIHLAVDPRDLGAERRLLLLPDGTWLSLVDADTLRYGDAAGAAGTVDLPEAMAVRRWSTISVVSRPANGGSQTLSFYLDGYRAAEVTHAGAEYFRLEPGVIRLGAVEGGFKGWVDDFKIIAREPDPEVICNHARGTLVAVESGDPLHAQATAYPAASHAAVAALLPGTTYDTFACERPIDAPVDIHDAADHSHYSCLGQIRRLDRVAEPDKCVRDDILFPERPLFWDAPRPVSLSNAFCTSCHVDSHPSATLQATAALGPSMDTVENDPRRQPMQSSPKIFGNVPQGLFEGIEPMTTFQTPEAGTSLDPYLLPEQP